MHEPGEGADRANIQETIHTLQLQLDLLRERVEPALASGRSRTSRLQGSGTVRRSNAVALKDEPVKVMGSNGKVSVVRTVQGPAETRPLTGKATNKYVPYRYLPQQAVPPVPAEWQERLLHDLRWVEPLSVLEIADRLKKPKTDVADAVGKLYAAGKITYLTSAPPPPGQVISDRHWNIVWVARMPLEALRDTTERRRFIVWLMLRCACGHAELRRATGLERNALDSDLVEIRRHEPVWDYGYGTKNNMYAVRSDWRPAPKGSQYDGSMPPTARGAARTRSAGHPVESCWPPNQTPPL